LGTKLHNAPLVLVKSRIWWHLYNHQSFENAKLLNGILYSFLRDKYQDLKINPTSDGNISTSVFSEDGELELIIEISNSDLSIISTHENYTWEKYSLACFEIIEYMFNQIQNLWSIDHIHGELEYNDLFKFKQSDTHLSYLSKLKVDLSSSFLSDGDNIMIAIHNKESKFFIEYSTHSEKELFVRMKMDSHKIEPSMKQIKSWFEESHDYCSKKFELMIAGVTL